MKKALIIKCSPRPCGVSDRLGDYFFNGLSTLEKSVLALRDYKIAPCKNCQHCNVEPFSCPLDEDDETQLIYDQIFASDLVLFSSPIYFYSLPAHFKAFIDRAQRFYQEDKYFRKSVKFIIFLAAGRPRGEKLFSGALLTLKTFINALHFQIDAEYCWRGLDNVCDLEAKPEIEKEIQQIADIWCIQPFTE